MIREFPPLPLPQYAVVRIGCSPEVPAEIAADLQQVGVPAGLIGYEYQPLAAATLLVGTGESGLVVFGTSGLFGRLGIDVASGSVDYTGKVVQRFLTKAGKTLFYREPEGMMVYQTVGGHMRLCFGFASRPSMTSSTRYASVYYKDVLI